MAKKQKKVNKKKTETTKRTKAAIANHFKYFDNFWLKHWIIIPIFFTLSFGIYFQCIPFNYVLDDQIVILDNAYTKEGVKGLWKIFSSESFEGYFGKQRDLVQGGRYRPLSIMMFAVEHQISPLNYKLNHIINIILYSICCLLLFRFLSSFLYDKKKPWFLTVAFMASLIYLVHPVHVEAVANIKGRDEILAFIFGLATLISSIRYLKTQHWKEIAFAALFYYLGVLSKENVLTFIGVVPVTLLLFTKGKAKYIRNITLAILAVTVLYLIQRYAIIGYLISDKKYYDVMNNPFVGMSGSEKYATIFYTLLKYLGLSVFPHPLTHDYYPYHIPIMNWAKPAVFFSFFLHAILGVLALFRFKKNPIFSWGILFYLFTISIVSNIVFNVGTFMNERFIFISSAGIIVILTHYLFKALPEKFGVNKNIFLGLAAVITILFAARSITRVPVWESAISLNRAAVKVSKNSARANSFMSTALFEEAKAIDGAEAKLALYKEAEFYVNRALKVLPSYKNANLMKIGIAAEFHKRDKDTEKLIKTFSEVAAYRPELPFLKEYVDFLADRGEQDRVKEYYYDVGYNVLYQKMRKFRYALEFLKKAYTLDASDQRIRAGLRDTYRMLGDETKAKQYE